MEFDNARSFRLAGSAAMRSVYSDRLPRDEASMESRSNGLLEARTGTGTRPSGSAINPSELKLAKRGRRVLAVCLAGVRKISTSSRNTKITSIRTTGTVNNTEPICERTMNSSKVAPEGNARKGGNQERGAQNVDRAQPE